MYNDESKVLQYFGDVRHNLTIPDACAGTVKVTNHNGQWDAKLTWYSLNATHLIYFYG